MFEGLCKAVEQERGQRVPLQYPSVYMYGLSSPSGSLDPRHSIL